MRPSRRHILVGLFRLAWEDPDHTIPGINLNELPPSGPQYAPLWSAVHAMADLFRRVESPG